GYVNNVSLMLVAGTGESFSETPVAVAVISCQPVPLPSQLSLRATVAPVERLASARRSQTSRPTVRLMAPGRSVYAEDFTCQATCFPLTERWSPSARDAH